MREKQNIYKTGVEKASVLLYNDSTANERSCLEGALREQTDTENYRIVFQIEPR